MGMKKGKGDEHMQCDVAKDLVTQRTIDEAKDLVAQLVDIATMFAKSLLLPTIACHGRSFDASRDWLLEIPAPTPRHGSLHHLWMFLPAAWLVVRWLHHTQCTRQ